jgi:hypothetical protein
VATRGAVLSDALPTSEWIENQSRTFDDLADAFALQRLTAPYRSGPGLDQKSEQPRDATATGTKRRKAINGVKIRQMWQLQPEDAPARAPCGISPSQEQRLCHS